MTTPQPRPLRETQLDAVADLPAIWLDAEDVRAIRARMARAAYDPDATEVIRALLCGIHDLCIEIDRCHERLAAVGG